MKAITYRRYGSPEVLALEEVPEPTAGPGELLVRVTTTVVTPPDCAARSGDPWFARLAFGLVRPRALVLGGECAGVVEAVGPGVTRFAPGDRVVAASAIGGGMHAERVRAPADGAVVAIPPTVTDEDAVAVADGGLTALPFLRDAAGLAAGQTICVNGAAGSVGSAAVQLAALMGARVTGVCSTANVELVRSLGAERVVDRTQEDFTATRGAFDVVFDAVGRSTFWRCRRALRRGGAYLTTVPSIRIMVQTLATRVGRRLGGRRAAIAFTGLRRPADRAEDLVHLLDLAAAGRLRPVIDRRVPLEDVPEAHRYVDTGRKRGSVVVTVAPPVVAQAVVAEPAEVRQSAPRQA